MCRADTGMMEINVEHRRKSAVRRRFSPRFCPSREKSVQENRRRLPHRPQRSLRTPHIVEESAAKEKPQRHARLFCSRHLVEQFFRRVRRAKGMALIRKRHPVKKLLQFCFRQPPGDIPMIRPVKAGKDRPEELPYPPDHHLR